MAITKETRPKAFSLTWAEGYAGAAMYVTETIIKEDGVVIAIIVNAPERVTLDGRDGSMSMEQIMGIILATQEPA